MLIQKVFQDDRQRRSSTTIANDLHSHRKCPLGVIEKCFLISLILLTILLGGVSAYLMLKGNDNKIVKNC